MVDNESSGYSDVPTEYLFSAFITLLNEVMDRTKQPTCDNCAHVEPAYEARLNLCESEIRRLRAGLDEVKLTIPTVSPQRDLIDTILAHPQLLPTEWDHNAPQEPRREF